MGREREQERLAVIAPHVSAKRDEATCHKGTRAPWNAGRAQRRHRCQQVQAAQGGASRGKRLPGPSTAEIEASQTLERVHPQERSRVGGM